MTRAIIVVVLISVLNAANADTLTEAERLYEQGQAAFDTGRSDEAVSAWERSYELSKEPALLFNIGQAYRQRQRPGDCTKASQNYQRFIELDAGADQRLVAEGFIAELKPCAARAIEPVGVPVTVTVTEPPTRTVQPADTIRPGQTAKIVGLAVVGSGAALLATGIYFGHRASSLGDEVSNACRYDCDWAMYSDKDAAGRSAQTKQYVFGGLGVAAIIGGGVSYWFGVRAQSRVRLGIAPQRSGAAITWSSTW